MSIAVYKNVLDKELKRFCQIADIIHSQCDNVEIVALKNVDMARAELSKYKTILFITHGDKNSLYHNWGDNIILATSDNDTINVLKDKKIIALSCCTGEVLGKVACEKSCIVYLGVRHRIHFDIKEDGEIIDSSNGYKNFIKDIYKSAFGNALVKGISKNVTFQRLGTILQIELSKSVYKENEIRKEKNMREYQLEKFQYTINAVLHVADSIVIHGDGNQNIR